MLTKDCLDYIRDLVYNQLGTGYYGTDATTPSETDTNLGSVVSSSAGALTKTKFTKGIKLDHSLSTSAGNTNTLYEYGIKFSNGTLFNRVVFPAIDKDNTVELTNTTQFLIFQTD